MRAPISVGIVGAGLSATTFHTPFLTKHPGFKIVSFVRNQPAPVPGYEQVPVVIDLNECLKAVDLVVITTPTHTHYELAKKCLEADKHVVLEKPMTANFTEAQELCRLCRQRNKLLAVYQNRRWDGDFLTVLKLIKSGALGRIVEYESHFDRFRNAVKPGWKEQELPGAGVLYDLGAHLVDQALTLFGQPVAVTGHVLNQRQLPATTVPDAFTVTLHYEPHGGPLTVILRASMLAKIPGPRFILHGTQGTYIKHGLDVQEGQLRAGMAPTDPGFGHEGPEGFGVLDTLALDLSLLPRWRGQRLLPVAEDDSSIPEHGSSATAAAAASSSGSLHCKAGMPIADVATVAAGVLAKIDSGGTASAAGQGSLQDTTLKVATEEGCWMEFYNDIASILLGHGIYHHQASIHKQPGHQQQQPDGGMEPAISGVAAAMADRVVHPAGAPAPGEVDITAAAAIATRLIPAGPGSSDFAREASALGGSSCGSSGSAHGRRSSGGSGSGSLERHSRGAGGDINSLLAVQPEQAANVIRMIEVAMLSSKKGRTIKL